MPSSSPSFLQPLARAHDPSVYGGKAANLARLLQLGMQVPSGFVISAERLGTLVPKLRKNDVPAEFAQALDAYLSSTRATEVMVRSSAAGEDGARHSFAGQFDSFRVPRERHAVIDAICRCADSQHTDRAKAYAQQRNAQSGQLAVILQDCVDVAYAGVAFSRETPLPPSTFITGPRERLLVEMVPGHGEALVSGALTPTRMVYDRQTAEVEFPFADGDTMAAELAKRVVDCVRRIEAAYRCDVDVEWAVDRNDALFVVQARPVTIEATRWHLWSSVNLRENYPEAISPFLAGMAERSYRHYFLGLAETAGLRADEIHAMWPSFDGAVRAHGARLHYNISALVELMHALPFGPRLAKAFLDFVGHYDSYQHNAYAYPLLRSAEMQARIAAKLGLALTRAPTRVRRFERAIDAFFERETALTPLPAIREMLHIRFHTWKDAAVADLAAMLEYATLKAAAQQLLPELGPGGVNTLLTHAGGLVSTGPSESLERLSHAIAEHKCSSAFVDATATRALELLADDPELNERLREHLDAWGFRDSGELMLTYPSFVEEPERLMPVLQNFVRTGRAEPPRSPAAPTSLLVRCKQHLLTPLARRAGGAIAMRESVRMRQAKLYARLRKRLLELGQSWHREGSLQDPTDVFFLRHFEVEHGASSGPLITVAQLQERKAEWNAKAADASDLPQTFWLPDSADHRTMMELCRANLGAQAFNDALVQRGQAVSAGSARGRARVLHHASDAARIEPGDIVVVSQTDPGWAIIFPLISGLIVENGGMLSHGAILAREFGIPAVAGIPGVKRWLADEPMIALSGTAGSVERVAVDGMSAKAS